MWEWWKEKPWYSFVFIFFSNSSIVLCASGSFPFHFESSHCGFFANIFSPPQSLAKFISSRNLIYSTHAMGFALAGSLSFACIFVSRSFQALPFCWSVNNNTHTIRNDWMKSMSFAYYTRMNLCFINGISFCHLPLLSAATVTTTTIVTIKSVFFFFFSFLRTHFQSTWK